MSDDDKLEQTAVNDSATNDSIDTWLTRVRSPGVHGHTYFVRRADGLIKIGFSAKPGRRVKSLAREHGTLDVLAIVPCSVAGEFETHQQFADLRAEGEWFRSSPTLLAFIEAIKDQPEPAKLVPVKPVVHPAIAEIKALRRKLSSRWNKLPKQARNFALNLIAQAKGIETLEDLERLRPFMAYQSRRLAEAMAA